jgi:hypothetical protein
LSCQQPIHGIGQVVDVSVAHVEFVGQGGGVPKSGLGGLLRYYYRDAACPGAIMYYHL